MNTLHISDSSDTTQEALHTMLCIAVSKEGLVRMLDPDVLKNILELVAETSNRNVSHSFFHSFTMVLLTPSPPL